MQKALLAAGFFTWLINLEAAPGLGRVWLRPDSQNVLRVSPGGIFAIIKACFKIPGMWKPAMWDANFLIMTLGPAMILFLWRTLTNKILPIILR